MDVRHKSVAKGVARCQITRFKHEDYVQMYSGGALTNVVNCRIGSNFHQVRLTYFYLNMHDSTLDCLCSGVNHEAGEARILSVRR